MKITFIAVALTQALAVAASALPAAVNTTDTESAHALEARGPCSITLQWHSWWREGVWDRYRVKVTAAGKGPKQIGEPFQTEFNMLQEWCHIVQTHRGGALNQAPLNFQCWHENQNLMWGDVSTTIHQQWFRASKKPSSEPFAPAITVLGGRLGLRFWSEKYQPVLVV